MAVTSLTLLSCNPDNEKVSDKKTAGPKENNKMELAPFIINEVVLNDSIQVKALTNGFTKEGNWFPTETSFGYNKTYSPMNPDHVKALIQSLRTNPNLKIYLGIDSLPLDKGEAFMFLNGCDSIVDLDDKGKAKGPAYLVCDSTSMYSTIKKILFFESWSLNKDNGSIEKTVLGYSFLSYIESKNQYDLMFYIFPDDASLATTKKYLSLQVKGLPKK